MNKIWSGRPPRAITAPAAVPHIEAEKDFDVKEYDITNIPECICNCLCSCGLAGCRRVKLTLDKDEMTILTKDFCLTRHARTPYGNLGSVETETSCCCCS